MWKKQTCFLKKEKDLDKHTNTKSPNRTTITKPRTYTLKANAHILAFFTAKNSWSLTHTPEFHICECKTITSSLWPISERGFLDHGDGPLLTTLSSFHVCILKFATFYWLTDFMHSAPGLRFDSRRVWSAALRNSQCFVSWCPCRALITSRTPARPLLQNTKAIKHAL